MRARGGLWNVWLGGRRWRRRGSSGRDSGSRWRWRSGLVEWEREMWRMSMWRFGDDGCLWVVVVGAVELMAGVVLLVYS